MAGGKRQRKQNPQNAHKPPRDWKQIHPNLKMVMYHAGEWHEMACYECGINRNERGAFGKQALLDHITRQHGRYCDADDMTKNETDDATLERCKQRRKFSEEEVEKMKRGEHPEKRVTFSKVPTKKPHKKSMVGANKQDESEAWIDPDKFVPSI